LYPILETKAKLYLSLNNSDLAKKILDDAICLNPYDIKPYMELGNIFFREQKYSDSLRCFQQAIPLGPPGTYIAWHMAGMCFELMHEYDSSLICFINALKIKITRNSIILSA
jgi:tetratricopeptide (TPR) repeat protein